MPIEKRGGHWWVRIRRGGKEIRRSVRKETGIDKPSQKDAQRYHDQLIAELSSGDQGLDPIWDAAIAHWLDNHLSQLKGQRTYLNSLNAIRPFFRGRRFSETLDIVAAIKRDAAARGLKPTTVNRRLAILRRVANLAVDEWGWISHAPRVKLLSEKNSARHVYLSPTEVAAMANEAERLGVPEVGKAILIAAYTGLRRGELLRLDADDYIDSHLYVRESKNARPRVVPAAVPIRPALDTLPLLLTDTTLKDTWTEIRENLGYTKEAEGLDSRFTVTWHDLRHTCASWLIQAGVELLVVSKILGHANVTVTQRYAHLITRQLEEAVDRMPKVQLKVVK